MKSKPGFHIRLKYIIRTLFVLAFVAAVVTTAHHALVEKEQNYSGVMNMVTAVMGFGLTFIPEAVETITKKKIQFSEAMQCAIVLFIFGAELLGEINSFYDKIPWWDNFLHSVSGVILAMIGFMLVRALNNTSRAMVTLSPIFIAMFAFFFAFGCGALWEVFEFAGDRLLGMNMQKFRPPDGVTALYSDTWRYDSGLIDTMTDLILDAICAFGVSVIGYIQLKYSDHKKNRRMKLLFAQSLVDDNEEK